MYESSKFKTNFSKHFEGIDTVFHIRALDFLFPACYKGVCIEEPYLYCLLGSLKLIKRIIKIEKDLKNGEYSYFLEERIPNSQIHKGVENFNAIYDFIKEIDIYGATFMKVSLQQYFNFIIEGQKICSENYFKKDEELLIKYKISLPDEIEYYIKAKPYFSIKYQSKPYSSRK